MKRIGLLLLVLVLAGCAVGPRFGPDDRTALEPYIDDYHQCLEAKTEQMIHGTRNVRLLTRVILNSCNHKLQPIGAYLDREGFSDIFISDFLHDLRYEAGNRVSAHILRVRSSRTSSEE